jgi:hypothetical protein
MHIYFERTLGTVSDFYSEPIFQFCSILNLCPVLTSVNRTPYEFSILSSISSFFIPLCLLLICFHSSVHRSQFCSPMSVPVLNFLSLCTVLKSVSAVLLSLISVLFSFLCAYFSTVFLTLRQLLICFPYSAPVHFSLTFYLSSLIFISVPCSKLLLLVISSFVPLFKPILLL